MWRLRSLTRVDFPIAAMRQVEAATGESWWRLDPCGDLGHAKAVLALEMTDAEIGKLTVGELEELFMRTDGDDLPTEFEGIAPVDGRVGDDFVVWAAYKFHWPPDVTERQTMRNLVLLNDAVDDGDDG